MALKRRLFVFILLCCVIGKVTPQRAQVCDCNIARCKQICDSSDRLNTACYKSTSGTRSCSNVNSCRVASYCNQKYEVHVLASYEARTDHSFGNHPVGNSNVRIVSSLRTANNPRPIVLVLTSYEPVSWNILGLSSDRIKQVLLISYYSARSQITGVSSDKQEILQQTSTLRNGYGADVPDTQKMLKYVVKRYGTVTSFTGRYTANDWKLTVGVSINAQVCGCNIARCKQNCNTADRLNSGCYRSFRTSCDNVYSCRVVDYYNSKYEVHVLSSYEARTDHGFRDHPAVANASVRIVNSPRRAISSRPIVLVLASYESVAWNIEGLSSDRIKQVILISHYSARSHITGASLDKHEKKYFELRAGYGAGGPDTGNLLKYIVKRYGPITLFTGRYTANIWNLTVGVPILVTDALKNKRCFVSSRTPGLGIHSTSVPETVHYHTTHWNNNYTSNNRSVNIALPFIIVAVLLVLVSIIAKLLCRSGSNTRRPRQTNQRSRQIRGLQTSTNETIAVPPVRESACSSPLNCSNTNRIITARETPTLDSGTTPQIQFPVDSNLLSHAPPSYEDATAHVPLPTYEQAAGKTRST